MFTLQSIAIDGATAISAAELVEPFQGEIGQQISVARVYEIAAAMTATIRDAGYVLTTVAVPAQAIEQGRVKLTVVEGFLSDVRFEGYTGHRDGMLSEIRSNLTAERPLHLRTLERELLLLNDLPGTTAQGILTQSDTESGGSVLTIRLARRAIGFDAGSNNRGSKVQGPTRYETGLELNSIFGLFEETRLNYMMADPSSELKYGFLSHSERLSANGLDWRLYGSRSRSEPQLGVDFQDLNLETNTEQAGTELRYPIVRSRDHNLYIRGALTYHDGITDDSSFDEDVTHDTIAAVRAGITLDSIDSLGGVNLLDLEISQGIDVFGASEKDDLLLSRSGGSPDFSKVTLYVARLQSIGRGWSALIAGTGQYAFNNLLAPEEFGFGGELFGRAYDGSELVGDSGLAGKVELRYTWDSITRGGLTLYGFFDTGRVWQRLGPDDFDVPEEDGASAYGGGLRFTVSDWLTGYAEVAVPSDQIVSAEGNDDTRYFAGLRLQFGSTQLR